MQPSQSVRHHRECGRPLDLLEYGEPFHFKFLQYFSMRATHDMGTLTNLMMPWKVFQSTTVETQNWQQLHFEEGGGGSLLLRDL